MRRKGFSDVGLSWSGSFKAVTKGSCSDLVLNLIGNSMKEWGWLRSPVYAEQSGRQVKLNLVDVMSCTWDVLKIVRFWRNGFIMLTCKVQIRPKAGWTNLNIWIYHTYQPWMRLHSKQRTFQVWKRKLRDRARMKVKIYLENLAGLEGQWSRGPFLLTAIAKS